MSVLQRPSGVFLLGVLMVASHVAAQPPSRDSDRRSRNDRRRAQDRDRPSLRVGDEAPLFTLRSEDGKQETVLAGFRDQRPVILLFGSYT